MQDIRKNLLEKMIAFAIHFAISFFILVLITLWVYFIWYPQPLLQAVGGEKILGLMILVDLILGPILTFIVYKKNKKTLRFDLSVIAIIQLLAIFFAVSSLALAKPVWIAFHGNKFELIQKNDLIHSDEEVSAIFNTSNYWSRPEFVSIKLSDSLKKRSEQVMDEVLTGISMAQNPKNYSKFNNFEVLEHAKPIEDLLLYNSQQEVKPYLHKKNIKGWLPLKTKGIDMVAIVKNDENQPEIVNLRPWD